MDRIRLQAMLVTQLASDREAPGGVDPAAPGREHDQPPVADLVAEALDHDGRIGGHDPGRVLLVLEVGDQVAGRARVEVMRFLQFGRVGVHRLAGEGADRLTQLGRPADPVPLPEGDRARHPGGGDDDHPVTGDLLNPPARCAEQEDLAGPGLVDHLLVQLADPAAVRQVDAIEPSVRDRAGVGHDQRAGALAALDGLAGPVPDQPRPKLGETIRRVAAVEHVEHVLELLDRKLGEGRGTPDQLEGLVGAPFVERRHRDQVLGEHVERVGGDDRLFDLAFSHPPGDHRAFQQVTAELGEDPPLRSLAETMAGPADPLQAAGHRLRRFDLDDQVDRPHVDPQLQGRGRDQAGDQPRLELLLDLGPLLMRKRAVMGPGQWQPRGFGRLDRHLLGRGAVRRLDLAGLLVEVVQPLGEPFGSPAVVDEDDGRGVGPDLGQQLGIDRRPDRADRRVIRGTVVRGADLVYFRLRRGHVLDRDHDFQVELFALARVDHPAFAAGAGEESRDPLQRPLGRREADPLNDGGIRLPIDRQLLVGVLPDQMFEPFQGQGEVGAALGRRDRVDLVDDHRFDPGQDLPGPGREHQVERLGSGDQDLRWLASHPVAFVLRRVTGAEADRDVEADAPQRRPQVALDVVGERLQRRDVDQPDPRFGLRNPAGPDIGMKA